MSLGESKTRERHDPLFNRRGEQLVQILLRLQRNIRVLKALRVRLNERARDMAAEVETMEELGLPVSDDFTHLETMIQILLQDLRGREADRLCEEE